MGNSILPLQAVSGKKSRRSNGLQAEMRVRAVWHALWVALFAAQEAGFDDVVDQVGRLHIQVRRRLQALQEVA
jgi:hypothetical protein